MKTTTGIKPPKLGHPSLITVAGFPMDTPRADVHIPQQMWINEQLHPPMMVIDKTVFVKSTLERKEMLRLRTEHSAAMKASGKNPKRFMNPDSQSAAFLPLALLKYLRN